MNKSVNINTNFSGKNMCTFNAPECTFYAHFQKTKQHKPQKKSMLKSKYM